MTNKINKQSADIQQERLAELKRLFPDLFDHEGHLNEKELKALTQNYSVPQVEKFVFEWAGKQSSKKVAFKPSKATLKLDKEKSINFENTDNLIIEGDNLEVLKLLRASYFEQVKCIYIDPPYNTGNDFIYPDNFSENKQAYWEKDGTTQEGVKLDSNNESKGRYHSDWLNMMQSRLLLSRNLLREDGVIFVSIDDNEVHNLRKLMDEVFGEENFVAQLPTIMNLKGNNDEFGFAGTHEYTIVFAKNKETVVFGEFTLDEEEQELWEEDEYGFFKKGANLKATGTNAPRDKRPNLYFPLYIDKDKNIFLERKNKEDIELLPITDGNEMSWRWSKNKIKNELHNLILVENGDINLYKKQRPNIGDLPTKKPKSIFYKPEYSSGNGTAQLKKLFDGRIFSNPKPLDLIKDFFQIATNENDLILDFFAGSGTTAQAVMELNKEDQGNRKFILVQIPEYTFEASEAHKAGYKTIADICIERVKRAGEKIKEENPNLFEKENKLDTGFKVFQLTHSHFTENLYAPDPEKSEEENIKAFDDYLKKHEQTALFDFSFEGLLYEIALKDGFDLNFTYEQIKDFDKNKVYLIKDKRDKEALICLDKDLDEATVKKMIQYNKEKRFIYLGRAVDTTRKWTLKNALGEKLLWEV